MAGCRLDHGGCQARTAVQASGRRGRAFPASPACQPARTPATWRRPRRAPSWASGCEGGGSLPLLGRCRWRCRWPARGTSGGRRCQAGGGSGGQRTPGARVHSSTARRACAALLRNQQQPCRFARRATCDSRQNSSWWVPNSARVEALGKGREGAGAGGGEWVRSRRRGGGVARPCFRAAAGGACGSNTLCSALFRSLVVPSGVLGLHCRQVDYVQGNAAGGGVGGQQPVRHLLRPAPARGKSVCGGGSEPSGACRYACMLESHPTCSTHQQRPFTATPASLHAFHVPHAHRSSMRLSPVRS